MYLLLKHYRVGLAKGCWVTLVMLEYSWNDHILECSQSGILQ
jgi:hypothetical protein